MLITHKVTNDSHQKETLCVSRYCIAGLILPICQLFHPDQAGEQQEKNARIKAKR